MNNTHQMKRACVAFAAGCPRSQVDAGKVTEYLKANRWKITTDLGKADLVLLGTCGSDLYNEEKSINYISVTLKKIKKSARLILFGCLPGINKERLVTAFGLEMVTQDAMDDLDCIIDANVKYNEIPDPNYTRRYRHDFYKVYNKFDNLRVQLQLAKKFRRRTLSRILIGNKVEPIQELFGSIFDIRIAQGCSGKCSYCAIRFSEGPTVSKPAQKILMELQEGLRQKQTALRLIATDVGAYGQDIGSNIAKLLDEIFKVPVHFRLIWNDFNPRWLIEYFDDIFALLKKNVDRIGNLGFPVQSGSEKIIEAMKRGHTVRDAKNCLMKIREEFPQIKTATHILVGFPGETDQDFEDTLALLRAVSFSRICIYKYDDRPMTDASKMKNKISENVKTRRVNRILKEFRHTSAVA